MDYRENAKEPVEQVRLRFDFTRFPKNAAYWLMAGAKDFFEEGATMTELVFFHGFMLNVLCAFSLIVSGVFFGGISMWGYHLAFWHLAPYFLIYVYRGFHLDNPVKWEYFKAWCNK